MLGRHAEHACVCEAVDDADESLENYARCIFYFGSNDGHNEDENSMMIAIVLAWQQYSHYQRKKELWWGLG